MDMIIKPIPENVRISHDKELIINSVNDAISLVKKLNNPSSWFKDILNKQTRYRSQIWYRGQADHTWELLPGVFREFKENGKIHILPESSMFNNFKMYSHEERKDCNSYFEWLCLMQHYGLPTRLLDWTESILVALYFAVCDEQITNDGTIFVILAPLLNRYSRIMQSEKIYHLRIPDDDPSVALRAGMAWKEYKPSLFFNRDYNNCDATGLAYEKIFNEIKSSFKENDYNLSEDAKYFLKSLSMPVAVVPYRSTRRMIAQFSMTTLHGGKLYLDNPNIQNTVNHFEPPLHLESLNSNVCAEGNDPFLKAYKITGARKFEIKKDLECLGINQATLFPEIDKRAEYIKNIWLKDI